MNVVFFFLFGFVKVSGLVFSLANSATHIWVLKSIFFSSGTAKDFVCIFNEKCGRFVCYIMWFNGLLFPVGDRHFTFERMCRHQHILNTFFFLQIKRKRKKKSVHRCQVANMQKMFLFQPFIFSFKWFVTNEAIVQIANESIFFFLYLTFQLQSFRYQCQINRQPFDKTRLLIASEQTNKKIFKKISIEKRMQCEWK